MIKIICLGKIKEKYLTECIQDYQNRIKKYHKIEVIELKDENNLKKEEQSILAHLKPQDFIITLEIDGKELTSVELASLIEKTFLSASTITFVIGSSLGLSNKIKEKANVSLSFSKLTFPHGLFRGIVLEQIYRAFKINNNENYHK